MTHSRNYRTLRRLILPALAGGALAALAFAPTFGAEPVASYSEPKHWPFILIFMNIWKGVGYGSIVSKSIELDHSVVAGNPAKIIRENIDWKR